MLSSNVFFIYTLYISNNSTITRYDVLVLIVISLLVLNIFKTSFSIHISYNSLKVICFFFSKTTKYFLQ